MREAPSEAAADRINHVREHNRNGRRLARKGADHPRGHTEDRVGSQLDQLFRKRPGSIRIAGTPAKFDPEIAAFRPPQLRKGSPERRDVRLHGRIVLRVAHQHADQPRAVSLLCARRNRPSRRAAKSVMNSRRLMGSSSGQAPNLSRRENTAQHNKIAG